MPLNQDEKKEVLADTGFISEKIKQRPINRKKLFRRTVITFFLAIVFGIVACFTFLFLQPVFSDKLYPEAEPEPISFPEEEVQDELTPEEMYADDNQIAEIEAQYLEANQKDQIDEAIASYTFSAADYGKMMSSLKAVAQSVGSSIVTVTAVSNDTNWFSESFESSGSASGPLLSFYHSFCFSCLPTTSASISGGLSSVMPCSRSSTSLYVSTRFLNQAGTGAPRRPQFSIIDPASVRMYQSRTIGVTISGRSNGNCIPDPSTTTLSAISQRAAVRTAKISPALCHSPSLAISDDQFFSRCAAMLPVI